MLAAGIVPTSRYYVLNTAGVRSAASITVFDRTTQLPLKNVQVQIGDVSAKTNGEGWVKLHDIKLGTQQLRIQRIGFAEVSKTITLGLGSNPLGEEQLKAVGAQYKFQLRDYLTDRPLRNAEVASGEATAQSDDKGQAILTVDSDLANAEKISVEVRAKDYRTEKLSVATTTRQATKVTMAARQKHLFVSKQSGTYDVYQVDVDGKNKRVLLKGSGLEDQRITLVQHPEESQAALVSTRVNRRNQDGYLLQTLVLINTETGDTLTLDHSEEIRIIDWIKNRLVYLKTRAGTSAGNPERVQLMSYDHTTASNIQLATANYFSAVVSAKGSIYYATSNHYQGGQSQTAKINPDNTGRQVLVKTDIWSVTRDRYDELLMSSGQGWYSYSLGDNEAKKLPVEPTNQREDRFYLDAADGRRALWTDTRDGKGMLLKYDAKTKKDTVLASQSGLTSPVKWLGQSLVVYRVVTPAETADYILSLDGGTARKLGDVTNTAGFDRRR